MLTSTHINIVSFFYPIGITPAVSLTQSIPPKESTDILLLGCDDVHNILFTSHVDNRQMDITCCDLQKAIIARNILLLSLIIDNSGENYDSLSSIYYDLYLDNKSIDLLRSQAKKLFEMSTTMDVWENSKYASQLKFCDSATLADVRKMWEFYSLERKGAELSRFERHFQDTIKLAKKDKHDYAQDSRVFNSSRSANPTYPEKLEDLDTLHQHYWKYGSTELNSKIRAKAKHMNPMFLTLDDEAILHYGTDPLLAFHLTTAYAPLHPSSPFFNLGKGLKTLERIVAAIRTEFREWAISYRRQSANITIRFFVGDAVSFSHTLKHLQVSKENTAYWYRDRYHFTPLVLNGPDYISGTAPMIFDVIETSNLCDYLGSLNLLTATSPLLRNSLSSVLYADVMVTEKKTYSDVLDNMVCGHVPTISALLGLFPLQYWTNTSPVSTGDEEILEADHISSQMVLRTIWKRPVTGRLPEAIPGLMMLSFDEHQLAQVLYQVYLHMFLDDDIMHKISNLSLEMIENSPLVFYHRASFASFLRLTKTRVTCDWNVTMDNLIGLIATRPNAPMNQAYLEELFTYLHILDISSVDCLKQWHRRNKMDDAFRLLCEPPIPRISPIDGKWGDLRDWKNVPPVVCITLKIPRQKLSVFTSMDRNTLGTPTVSCLITGPCSSMWNTWKHKFPACQLAFGDISTKGYPHDDSYEIVVAEDTKGWKGTSDLIATFYVPSWFLLDEPRKATVGFGIQCTFASVVTFEPKLGLTLDVYGTTLDNAANVYITRFCPNQGGFPVTPGFSQSDMVNPSTVNPGTDTSLIAGVDQATGRITSLACRLDITSDDYNSILKNGCQVVTSLLSPYQVSITLGGKTSFAMSFPTWVVENSQKTRIARKSSYVEVVMDVATGSAWMNYPYCMYPVHLQNGKPVNWNMPYLNLSQCPIIDTKQSNKLNWLAIHASLAASAREHSLGANNRLPRSPGEQIRLDFKKRLFSMMTMFAGLRGSKPGIFALGDAASGIVNTLILVSSLRIDLGNRTVALDCAVLPLYKVMAPQLQHCLKKPFSQGVKTFHTTAAALRLWRSVLPAYVERCRQWEHRDNCEYAAAHTVPLSIESGEPCLCSCGNGEFPPDFISGVAQWRVMSKYAVRAAISPPFWAPNANFVWRPTIRASKGECRSCGKRETEEGGELLSCGRCKEVKYCSRECQKNDWKLHKLACKKE
ncbi:hypothetical protein F5B20DRAFT_589950 [Whalleya microplaca]|nr:hypothetical protein F5B20DRAFT_589950 [Whalleya microplaca]